MKIGKILNELLIEDYKTQTSNFIRQGYDSNIVKQYIEKFKVIRDKGFKELFTDKVNIDVPINKRNDIDAYKDFHDLEIIVDYVGGQRAVKTSVSGEEIEVDGKPVYEDENFEIYFADTPRACIKYKGKLPYSWCIARSDSSNMFFTYRFKPYEPAFYFVKDKREFKKEFSVINVVKDIASGSFKYPYHFFVVQVGKNATQDDNKTQQYVVTSANNDGDKQMSWDDIVKLKPKLEQLKEVFKPKPFTPEERKKFESFKNGITDKEFQKLSYEEKREYLDIYPAVNRPITTNQFLNLPDDLKNLYLSFGIGLNDEQFEDIKNNKNLLKRYKQISERKFDEYIKKNNWERRQLKMSYTELLMLDSEKTKEYFTTLDKKELNNFIRTYGHDKIDYLIQHSEHFDKISKNETITLIRQAASGSEEASKKIDEMIPEGFLIYIEKDYVTIDGRGTNLKEIVDSDTQNFFERLDYRNWSGGYYDNYFEDDSDDLNETYKNYIESFIETGELKNNFLEHDLNYDVETIDDLLVSYGKKESCLDVLHTEFDNGMSESEQNAWDTIRNNISKILDFNHDDEVKINTTSFIIYLYYSLSNSDDSFFTTDEEVFEKNLAQLLENILEDNDEPNGMDDVYDYVNDSRYDFQVDTTYIKNKFGEYISDALDEFNDDNPLHDYDDYDEEPGDEKNIAKLKSQVVQLFNNTLKNLGFEPNQKLIQNDIVKIEFDKHRFNLNGKIYAYVTDLKNNKNYEGYMNIKDIPTYFKNYKLFEEINRIKKMF